MRKILFIIIFILLLISKAYSYSNPNISADIAIAIIGATDYISAGLDLIALLIGVYLAYTSSNRKFINTKIKGSLNFLIFAIAFWTVVTIIQIGLIDTVYSSTSPIAYLPILLFFIGSDERLWNTLLKIAPIFAVVYFVLCFNSYQTLVVNNAYRLSGNNPITVYLVSTIWWCAVSMINIRNRSKIMKLICLSVLIGCSLIAFSMTYRSWIIQSVLILMIGIIQLGQSKFSKFIIIILAAIAIYQFVGTLVNSSEWNDAFVALENKNQIDTRSFQYTEIFEQVSILTWLFGGGFNASYVSSLTGEEYKYIDNQYLFTAFHYGIFLLATWLYIWIRGPFKLMRKRELDLSHKSPALVCLLWLFALGGLSVYNAIAINPQNLLLSIILGRCYFLTSNYFNNYEKTFMLAYN